MNREIKFRAWDSVLGMKPVIVLAGDGAWWKVTTDISTYTLNNGVLMQSTGLRDRNGVEIYESDIVEWDDDSDGKYWRVAVVKMAPDIQFHIIANPRHPLFIPEGTVFNFGSFIYTDTENWLTVIGNIYENPELLEKEKVELSNNEAAA